MLASLALKPKECFPQNGEVLATFFGGGGVTYPFGCVVTSMECLPRKMHILKILPIISGFSVSKPTHGANKAPWTQFKNSSHKGILSSKILLQYPCSKDDQVYLGILK